MFKEEILYWLKTAKTIFTDKQQLIEVLCCLLIANFVALVGFAIINMIFLH